jgi:hypothetical protein
MNSSTRITPVLEPFHEGLTRSNLDSASTVRIDSIQLGRSPMDVPLRPTDVNLGPHDIVVADLPSQSVLRYDRKGRFLARYTHVGGVPLAQPLGVGRFGDTSFVLDITGPIRISRISAEPTLSVVDSGVPNAIDFAVANRTIFYGGTMSAPNEVGKGLLTARSPLGKVQWEACPANPTLVASVKARGAIAAHQTTRIAVSGNTVYCAQPSSPSIQLYGFDGAYRGRFDRVPGSYRSSTDAAMSASGIRQLQATWTPIVRMWPWSTGIAVEHVVLDTVANVFRNFLFVCDSAQGPTHCTYNAIPFRVLSYNPPDTAWALDNSNPKGPRLVAFRIVRRQR